MPNFTNSKIKVMFLKRCKQLRCRLLLFSFTVILYAMPGTARAQERKFSMEFQKESLESALGKLRTVTGVSIAYSKDDVSGSMVAAAVYRNKTVEELLKAILAPLPFKMEKKGTAWLISKKMVASTPASGKVAGKIIDEKSGEPVIGATIRIGSSGTVTGTDGSFMLALPAGNYTALVSSVGYGTKEISGIEIGSAQTFPLQVMLRQAKGQLSTVVVKASARKESIAALYARQKNASEITNGISAEEISRTPDRHIGESLKRISGISTNDNKYVIVRGIGERYNAAMLDGTVLPSTEAQGRNFSFDLIPSNLVDNVVVSKTVTPDMNVSFGGGLIQINTKDIPSGNFTSITAGVSYNDQTTGRDFYSRVRGKYDFLAFDDGHRNSFPDNLRTTDAIYYEAHKVPFDIYEQSRRFRNHDNFSTYRYTATPSQQYQFTIGRILNMDSTGKSRIGFTGSISYRNTQNTSEHRDLRRGSWHIAHDSLANNGGASYSFNTTIGALLNIGWQTGRSRFSLRNTYTRMFDNALVRTFGHLQDDGDDAFQRPPSLRETDDPTFLDLMQNKLSGQHQVGKVKVEWDLARTSVKRDEKDVIFTMAGPRKIGKDYVYFYSPGSATEPEDLPMSRSVYRNNERHYNWNLNASLPLFRGSTVKAGYAGNHKKSHFAWQMAPFTMDGRYFADSLQYLPLGEWGNHMADSTGFLYAISPWALDYYEGKSQSHAIYAMFDNRIFDRLRLVWGLRAEFYEYKEINNPSNTKIDFYTAREDKKWQLMPSANLTYNITPQINLRASWSNSVVRPELMDNSRFKRYSPYYDGDFSNGGIRSTRITSYDVKAEWFPGAGELISAGAFYKYFDNPVEMVLNSSTGNVAYVLQNSVWAKVQGVEFELRKNLGFNGGNRFLERMFFFGNLTLQRSKVQSQYSMYNSNTGEVETHFYNAKRELYGQVPLLVNAGLQYNGEHLGLNVTWNKAGNKTSLVSEQPTLMEREMPREQLDAQISYRMLKNRMELKLNMANLTDAPFRFYKNMAGIKEVDGFMDNWDGTPYEWNDRFKWQPGYSEKYEEGDMRTFTRYVGRSFSLSVSYNF